MAGDNCAPCGDALGDKLVACDSCHITVHPNETCTGLAASELRAVIIQKRTLNYFCSDCRLSFKSVPKLIREIETLRSEVSSLKSEIKKLKENKDATSSSAEEVLNELHERQKKANNLLIFNLQEPNTATDDINQVKSILNTISNNLINSNNIKISRFGNRNKNGHRPLRVIMSSSMDAHAVIKNKHICRDKKIFIQLDQTSLQRKVLVCENRAAESSTSW
uniref:Uncharacterized protein LOC114334520 n=1 Tax=Diabrotica virgifera virgifera TaxID=50390 RepID=A0A6P7FVK1_DIAVI